MRRLALRSRSGEIRAFALVDDDDYERISQWRWCLDVMKIKHRVLHYVSRESESGKIRMHRVIMEITDPKILVDHKNGDGLDNRKENLRVANKQQNAQNRSGTYSQSGFRGVYLNKRSGRRKRWVAQATIEGHPFTVGYFATPSEANDAIKEFRQEHMPYSEKDR